MSLKLSAKKTIIEALFKKRYSAATRRLESSVVTLSDVSEAIKTYNAGRATAQRMSDRNPANFFKDFIRKKSRANKNWPVLIFEAGFTARQVTGQNRCFEFVPLTVGQGFPFPEDLIPGPTAKTQRFQIETASLPLASRRLGRSDEPWLIQVLVRQRVIETHLSLVSSCKIVQLDHLQTNVKLGGSEIDALFLAVEEVSEGKTREMIVCCEAKGRRDDILQDQILAEAKAVFRMKGVTQDVVLPIAAKAMAPSEVYVVEFERLGRNEAAGKESLAIASSAVYELTPMIPGIGK